MIFNKLKIIKSPDYDPIRDTLKAIPYLLKYLTHIVILLEIALLTNLIPKTPYTIFNIFFLQVLVSIISFYFIYINPQTLILEVPNQTVIAKPATLKEVDIFSHQIPLLIMIYLYYNYIKLPISQATTLTQAQATLLKPKIDYNIIIPFMIFYIIIVDIKKLYKLNYTQLLVSLLLTILLFKFIL